VIIKTLAIPLAHYPYSSTSRIVHWLTRHHGKISTLLKGALRPKSSFLGEYELFSTSELLYLPRHTSTLHPGKECALLHPRPAFRTNWRAMQAASYISALFNRTLPEEAPHPGLFEFYEELLDLAEQYGNTPTFLPWAELQFCTHLGHTPNLGNCTLCGTPKNLAFSAPSGGTICKKCSQKQRLPTLGSPPEQLAILQNWQQTLHPQDAAIPTPQQRAHISTLLGTFMHHHFSIPSEIRTASGL
jgi:DNA repair protein RecO